MCRRGLVLDVPLAQVGEGGAHSVHVVERTDGRVHHGHDVLTVPLYPRAGGDVGEPLAGEREHGEQLGVRLEQPARRDGARCEMSTVAEFCLFVCLFVCLCGAGGGGAQAL